VAEEDLWLAQLRRGDPEGLRRIYVKYRDDLVRVAACLLGDLSSVEDCLQDVFVSLARRDRPLELRGSLRAYLVSCIVYQARARLCRRKVVEVQIDNVGASVATSVPDAVQIAIDREQAAELYRTLGQLPLEQREVITLHLHGQMTFQQIAEYLEVSINTVTSRYRYGLDKLKAMLNAGAQP
jgi:RNA polymerase sigma-70 factor (ECF subfamily)